MEMAQLTPHACDHLKDAANSGILLSEPVVHVEGLREFPTLCTLGDTKYKYEMTVADGSGGTVVLVLHADFNIGTFATGVGLKGSTIKLQRMIRIPDTTQR